MRPKIDITLENFSETLRVINETSFFSIWQSSPKEASEVFVKFVLIDWRKFKKDKLLKETYKVRNFFMNKKISNVEDLRLSYGEAPEYSSSVVLGSEKIKEVKCNPDDSKKQNQPIESVPELELPLEQNLHNVSNLLFFNSYYLLQKV